MKFGPALGLLAACGAQIDGRAADLPDSAPPIDGPSIEADAAPACFNGRVVFLSFEGETLVQGSPSDARQNRAQWMQVAQGTAPPYRANDANRMGQIQNIISGVQDQLASFPITVVTTRPATGEYTMIVYGGQPQQVGSRFGGAVQQLDCGDALTRNDVAWVSDNVTGTQQIVNFSIGAIGFGLGLTATSDPDDCMCGWDNGCNLDNTKPCTLTEGIARDPAANQLCPGVTTQNETTTFRAAFCE